MKDLSRVEPNITDLIFLTLYMLLGEQDRDYWIYTVDQERVPLLNYLHKN